MITEMQKEVNNIIEQHQNEYNKKIEERKKELKETYKLLELGESELTEQEKADIESIKSLTFDYDEY